MPGKNTHEMKAGLALLVSEKVDLSVNNIAKSKYGYFIMTKESIYLEDPQNLNDYIIDIQRFTSHEVKWQNYKEKETNLHYTEEF